MTLPSAYLPTPPNLLPVDPATGGQAMLVGWYDGTGALSAPVVVSPLETGEAVTPSLAAAVGQGWATRTPDIAGPPIEFREGSPVRLSVTAGQPYGVVAGVYAVRTDNSIVLLAKEWHPGPDRVGVTTPPVPVGTASLGVRVVNPASYVADPTTLTWWAQWSDIFGNPDTIDTGIASTDPAPATGVQSYADPVLVVGTYDPGPTPPTLTENTFGQWVWNMLPELYQRVDVEQSPDYPLLRYLQGAGVGSDTVMAVAAQVYSGDMTDPDAAPDEWLGWLMAALGVVAGPSPTEQRASITARITGARPGTTANLESYVAQFLTGSQYVVVGPSTTPWVLRVTVIDAETVAAGGTPGIQSALRRSGKLPAGWDVTMSAVAIAWDAVDTSFTGGTWDPRDTAVDKWAVIDSTGLT